MHGCHKQHCPGTGDRRARAVLSHGCRDYSGTAGPENVPLRLSMSSTTGPPPAAAGPTRSGDTSASRARVRSAALRALAAAISAASGSWSSSAAVAVVHPGGDHEGGGGAGPALGALGLQHRHGAHAEFGAAVHGDLGQVVGDPGVAEAFQQGGAVGRDLQFRSVPPARTGWLPPRPRSFPRPAGTAGPPGPRPRWCGRGAGRRRPAASARRSGATACGSRTARCRRRTRHRRLPSAAVRRGSPR